MAGEVQRDRQLSLHTDSCELRYFQDELADPLFHPGSRENYGFPTGLAWLLRNWPEQQKGAAH